MSIPPLNFRERWFIAAHKLTAICISRTGRIYTSSDPQGATACFWIPVHAADELSRRVWDGEDVEVAAHRMQIKPLLHPVMGGLAKRKSPASSRASTHVAG
jgi:hypothetical protein